ncbi:MAG: Gfo/Idh/MocA family oxidoreductase [Rubricoccaceae bacterium]|nr:Gfo/Idh/MocA family oxidoreductase [Rubricoccaceae bacterium]
MGSSASPFLDRPGTVLIGYGYWGKNIARNLDDLGGLVGICDADADARERARERYPETRIYEAYADVLADDAVEAVAISTQARAHADLAIRALEAGKDVYVEKPLALNYRDGERMVTVADRLGRILMVGHLLEYHPAVLALERLIRQGELGRLQYVYSNRLNLGRFRREENALWSFAPHDIAVILRLVGESPIEVVATGGAYLQPNVADTTVTNMLFEDGLRAHIFVSWLHPYKEQRLVVVGSKKMAVFDDRAEPGEKLVVYDQGASWVDNRPIPRNGEGMAVDYGDGEPLRLEMEHFLNCVRTRRRPVTDGWSGLRVLHVLQTAQRSLQMGGSRVPLDQPTRSIAVL